MALNGYHIGDLPSTTFEEGPKDAKAWLHQRTRWMKGFLQTSFTHGRYPSRLLRRLGPIDSLCALTLIPGTVVSALLYPFLMPLTAYRLFLGETEHAPGFLANLAHGSSLVVFFGGLAVMLLPGLLGCRRRNWRDLYRFVPLLPFYYLLVSLAAWLAVFELARHPHRWNKTEHGLSRTSRSGALHLKRGATVRAGAPVPRPSPAAGVAG